MKTLKKVIQKFIHLRLRTRLIILASTFVVATSVFFYLYIINLQRNLFAESFIKSTESSLETVKLGMEEILTLESYETIEKLINLAKKEKHFDFYVITNYPDTIVATFPDTLKPSLKKLRESAAKASLKDSIYVLSSPYKSKLWNGELFVGYSTKEIRLYENKILVDVGTTNIIILFVVIFVLVIVATGITKPLEKLKDASERIRLGDFSSRADESKGGVEISSVSKAFNQMVEKLTNTQRELEKELYEAGNFVVSILPPPINEKIKIEWRFIPSRELGGDAFGYHYLDEDTLAIYLIDASGHGVSSSLLSVSAVNILRTQSLVNTNFYDPSSVLYSLNEIFQMERNGDKYFTIWYGTLNHKTKKISYSSAGHPPALIVRKKSESELIKLSNINNFIGFMPGIKFSSASFDLEENDSIYIYSDGLYEIVQPDGKVISQEEFLKSIISFNEMSLDKILLNLRSKQMNDTFTDDCALIRIQI